MATLNKVTGLIVGQYGNAIELQIVDSVGSPEPIDGYTGINVVTVSPDYETALEFTGSFSTDGTDGKLLFTPASNNTWDRPGTWHGQVELTTASVLALTVPFEADVQERLGS